MFLRRAWGDFPIVLMAAKTRYLLSVVGYFKLCFMATKTVVLRQTWGQVPAMSVVIKTRYFSKEVGLFPAKSGYFS